MFEIINDKFVFPYGNQDDSIKRSVLKNLLDNGCAQEDGGKCLVPFLNIYALDSFELSLLNLPAYYPFSIYIEGKGVLTTPNFRLDISFRTFEGGEILPKKELNGPIVEFKSKNDSIKYLLEEKQFEVVSIINEFNALAEKKCDINLKTLSKIQSYARMTGIILHSSLMNREIASPSKVVVHVEPSSILPKFGSKNDEEFVRQIDLGSEIKDFYSARRI